MSEQASQLKNMMQHRERFNTQVTRMKPLRQMNVKVNEDTRETLRNTARNLGVYEYQIIDILLILLKEPEILDRVYALKQEIIWEG